MNDSDRKNSTGVKEPVKEASVREAKEIIAAKGLEALSLREVARRLGVSHQAPYKHFKSRDHLLAEVIRLCLREFATELRRSGFSGDGSSLPPEEAMQNLGLTYLTFANRRPLEYRLMFATSWPEAAVELGLEVDARAAFDVLVERIRPLLPHDEAHLIENHAMFVWTSIHGLAGALESNSMQYLAFDQSRLNEMVTHIMNMIDKAVFGKGFHPQAER